MSGKSKIEWTDSTWTPIRARNAVTGKIGWHCQKISPGCENCYAESMNRRLGTRLSYLPGGEIKLFLDEKMLSQPLRWKKPRHIFVCSMTDLFADFVPDEWIDRIFAVMALAQDHTFQVLTKRAARMREYMEGRDWADAANAIHDQHIKRLEREMYVMGEIVPPLPNVQLGVSAEDQKRVDERVPDLLATPAAVRFVSAEPLLGPTKFRQDWVDYLKGWYTEMESGHDCDGTEESCMRKCPVPVPVQAQSHSLDWVIVGGESGPRRRPMELKWARSIRDQCREVGVSFFMKQVDKVIPVPNDLAIREMPTTREMLPAGDRSAGEW